LHKWCFVIGAPTADKLVDDVDDEELDDVPMILFVVVLLLINI